MNRSVKTLLLPVLMFAFALPVAGAGFGTFSADDEGRVILHGAAGEWRTLPSPVPVRVVERAEDRLRLELATADGPVAAEWTVDGGEATLRLSAPKDRAMTRPLAYPPAWETRKGDVGIHPFGEGAAFPADDPAAPAGGRLVSPFRRGHGVSMAFHGTVRGTDHLMSGVRDALYAQYVISNALPRTAFVEWLPEEGRWGSDRELRLFRGGSLGAVAGAYRAWRERVGRVTTLAERAKRNPKLLAFPGTADFWVWDDNAQNRLYNWPQVKESAPRDVRRIAGEMKALGLDRVLWNGFDDETPEDCAFLTGLGYLCGTYDCFRDVYHRELAKYTDVRNFARGARFMPFAEDVSCIRADGSIDTAWTIPDKQGKMHAMYGLCDMCGPELAKRLIEPDVRRIGYTARLMDVQAAEGPRPCFSPKHPCTLRQAHDAIREEHRYLSDDLSLVIGVEVGNENMVGTYAYSEGLTSKVGAMHRWCWRMKDHSLYGTEVPNGVEEGQHGRRYRVPLWQLVYHDCSVSYTYWGDTTLMYPATAPVKDLFCALYGEPPIYSMNVRTWDELKHEVAASYRHATPVARETMFARMTDYERLDPDGKRQCTTFANGVRVTADFDRLEYVLEVPGRAPRRVSVRESRELSIGNAELAVTFRTEDGSFDVLDKRCGKTWRALRGGKPPIAVRFANVVDGRIRFGFEAAGVKAGDRLDGELALEGPELVVRLSGPTNATMTSFDYPLPFASEAGCGERGGFKVPCVLRYAFFRDRCELVSQARSLRFRACLGCGKTSEIPIGLTGGEI